MCSPVGEVHDAVKQIWCYRPRKIVVGCVHEREDEVVEAVRAALDLETREKILTNILAGNEYFRQLSSFFSKYLKRALT